MKTMTLLAILASALVGCDTDGKLTAVRAKMLGDSGPYASVGMKVLERAAGHASGPYVTAAIDVEAIAVRTNNSVCGAFRGFGANQAQFAMEGALDRLAEKVGISGWEIRSRNVITPGEVWGPGQIMDSGAGGARQCLDTIKPHYDAARAGGQAIGLGLALKNSGLGNGSREVSRARVRFDDDGTVEVRHCWTEMGQGVDTVAVQVAAEELGVDPNTVRIVIDTTRELGAGQTTGSRGTVMAAGAVAAACQVASDGGRAPGVEYAGEYIVDWTNSLEEELENPTIHSAFGPDARTGCVGWRLRNVLLRRRKNSEISPILEGVLRTSKRFRLSRYSRDEVWYGSDGISKFPVGPTACRKTSITSPTDFLKPFWREKPPCNRIVSPSRTPIDWRHAIS